MSASAGLRPVLEVRDSNVVVRLGLGDGPALLRLPKGKCAWSVWAPDPDIAQVWVADVGAYYLVAVDELLLARELYSERRCLEDTLDLGAVAARFELGQAPLAPTILLGVFALVPGSLVRLTGCGPLDDEVFNATTDMTPVDGSVDQLVDFLIDQYRSVLNGRDEATVLLSAGWDSRLEIAAVKAAVGANGRIKALHLATNCPDEAVARAVSETAGAEFYAMPLLQAIDNGYSASSSPWRLTRFSTWRPTIPPYDELMARGGLPAAPIFGFTPYQLKGRDYGEPVVGPVPTTAKRIRAVGLEWAEALGTTAAEVTRPQETAWKQVSTLVRGWCPASGKDLLNWATSYAIGYSSRTRALNTQDRHSVIARREVVRRFMGLARQAKEGTAFIQSALSRLAPELLDIPVIASSGDAGPQGSFESRWDSLLAISSTVSPAQINEEYRRQVSLLPNRMGGLALPKFSRWLMELGENAGGRHHTNAVQLALFAARVVHGDPQDAC